MKAFVSWSGKKMLKKLNLLLIILFTMILPITSMLSKEAQNIKKQTYPQKIISLGPFITEELYLLGVEDRLIGCTVYCERPKEAMNKEKVSSAVIPNLEKIVSLKPDLILATSLIEKKSIKKLKNLGLRVEVFPVAKNFNELCFIFLKLGQIVGKEKIAQKIIKKSKKKVYLINQKVDGLNKKKVFIQIGANPLFTITKHSFINDLIEKAGGINITKDAKSGLYTREEVLNKNPDVIIIATMGLAGSNEIKIWKRFKTIKAIKNNRIYMVDANRFCSPTPVSFTDTLQEIINIFYYSTENKK